MGDKWPRQMYKQNFTEFIESYEVARRKFHSEKAQGIGLYDSVYNMIYCNRSMKSHIWFIDLNFCIRYIVLDISALFPVILLFLSL